MDERGVQVPAASTYQVDLHWCALPVNGVLAGCVEMVLQQLQVHSSDGGNVARLEVDL